MRSIELVPSLSLAAPRASRSNATFSSPASDNSGDDPTVVLPRPRSTRSLPFLAQYLAQEIIGPDAPSSRWSAREQAYRSAAAMTRPLEEGTTRLQIDA